MTAPVVTLLTDYGVGTPHVGALHAVLARECPAARLIDFAHDIPPGDVKWGALLLRQLVPELPGAVHLAVVDPGVGTDRRAIAMELEDGSRVVGPDNGLLGLLVPIAESAVRLTAQPTRSATFHGRDLFAPTAARLASGASLGDMGSMVALSSITTPVIPAAAVRPKNIHALIVGVDRFGNAALAADEHDLSAAGFSVGDGLALDGRVAYYVRTFADVASGEALVYIDSNEMISVAIRDGSAASEFALRVDDTVQSTPRDPYKA